MSKMVMLPLLVTTMVTMASANHVPSKETQFRTLSKWYNEFSDITQGFDPLVIHEFAKQKGIHVPKDGITDKKQNGGQIQDGGIGGSEIETVSPTVLDTMIPKPEVRMTLPERVTPSHEVEDNDQDDEDGDGDEDNEGREIRRQVLKSFFKNVLKFPELLLRRAIKRKLELEEEEERTNQEREQTFDDHKFDDQKFDDQKFDDQKFDDQKFDDQKFDDQKFEQEPFPASESFSRGWPMARVHLDGDTDSDTAHSSPFAPSSLFAPSLFAPSSDSAPSTLFSHPPSYAMVISISSHRRTDEDEDDEEDKDESDSEIQDGGRPWSPFNPHAASPLAASPLLRAIMAGMNSAMTCCQDEEEEEEEQEQEPKFESSNPDSDLLRDEVEQVPRKEETGQRQFLSEFVSPFGHRSQSLAMAPPMYHQQAEPERSWSLDPQDQFYSGFLPQRHQQQPAVQW